MPAVNMGGPLTVPANPSAGKPVLMSPFSGPSGSPFDAKRFNPAGTKVADPTNYSTGALSTGIGFGQAVIINPTAPASIKAAGFNDDYVPGLSTPGGGAATDARYTCIGGGRSGAATNGAAANTPYDAQPLLGFGNGGSRDAGAGPAFTGFSIKTVTATATVANGAVVETGWTNRSGVSIATGQSVFGSATAASPAVT
ncbi:hypothetical protein [Stenotrophomonas phage BUCT555]|nr:hypothetical protein [Stenotrophomonas phage BUCT555]